MFGRLSRILAGVGVSGLLATAGPATAQPGPQGPPAVGVIEARPRPVTESTEFVGRVEATDRVDLRARVTGFLQERLFAEGAEVRRGDVLYRIERAPFEAEVARSQGTVASAEAEQANARVALARAQDLARTGAGTRVTLDNATAQDRASAAQVLSAQAALRVAQINLGYTQIVAPIDGKIGRTNFTVGNVVGPDVGAVATIVSQDPMRVSFPVSARQIVELRNRYSSRGGVEAVQVRIRLSDGNVFGEVGRIEFVDNQIDRNTDTLLVRALIPNPTQGSDGWRALVDGQFVNVLVQGVEPVQAIVIPRAAVLQDQQGAYVFVVDEQNRAQRRNIRLGRSIAGDVVVEGGLETGMRMIAEGIQRARPGQPVNAQPVAAGPVPGQPGQGQGQGQGQSGQAPGPGAPPSGAAPPAPASSTTGRPPGRPQGPAPNGQAPEAPPAPAPSPPPSPAGRG